MFLHVWRTSQKIHYRIQTSLVIVPILSQIKPQHTTQAYLSYQKAKCPIEFWTNSDYGGN
jgi:hypothetical protein